LHYFTAKFKIRQPISIRDEVYKHLKREIIDNKIPSDVILVETHLAEEIGVSRTPVREALHFLQKEGLLEALPKTGYRVRQIAWQEVEEVVEIRKEVESLATRWAAERIKPEELEFIRTNLSQSQIAIEEGNLERFPELDAQFHETVARASRSGRLINLIQGLRSDMLRYRLRSLHLKETASLALAGHQSIFECIEKRNLTGIRSAVHKHLEDAKENIRIHAFQRE